MSANDLIDWIAYHANKQDRDWEYLRKELLRKVSQPSPSGDADYEKDARKLAKKLFPMYCEHFNGAYCDACAPMVIADALRSHDAKVSGQAEQRLRKALQQCAIKFREYATIHEQKEDTPENRKKIKANLVMAELAEAALQESPSEPAR